jgi:hypothetical protein
MKLEDIKLLERAAKMKRHDENIDDLWTRIKKISDKLPGNDKYIALSSCRTFLQVRILPTTRQNRKTNPRKHPKIH